MGITNRIKSALLTGEKNKPFLRAGINSAQYKGFSLEAIKIINLINYTKQNEAAYNAESYDGGYHTLHLEGQTLQGQRDAKKRLANLDYDFTNKAVLDLGCNQGGMLHALADQIRYGVGLDYDPKMINIGNRVSNYNNSKHIQFYVFNLEKEPLDLIHDLSPVESFDIVFMLSISMWIDTWKEVLAFGSKIGKSLLFETNGTKRQQEEQIFELGTTFTHVTLVADRSEDDPLNKQRQLYFCKSM
nr:class I SAM-dependent methyltransferase [Nitrosomonas nitrosa]